MVFSKPSWIALGFGALGFLGCGGADFGPTGQGEAPTEGSAKFNSAKTFLSLGDSIAFGYNPLVPQLPPSNFTGYPEVLASRGFDVTNASCPGETSGSFLDPSPATAPDNGCRFWKSHFALHADYETTQIVFTVGAIQAKAAANEIFDFVTLNIGANDLFVLQASCGGQLACIQAGLPGVVAAYSQHIANAYEQMKAAYDPEKPKFKGKFIGVTTYATNYNDPLAVGALSAINEKLRAFTALNKGRLADGYVAFQTASASAGGDACAAGLLIRKPDNTCDIHPSQTGRELLAQTVIDVLEDEQ
jgi:lysophospholipase L1-like esterase